MKKYKIAVAGTGYVGLSIATLLSQHHHVTAVDILPEKVALINARKSPIQDDYIEKYLAEKELDLTATLDAKAAYADADFVVIAAPTNYDSQTQHFDTSGLRHPHRAARPRCAGALYAMRGLIRSTAAQSTAQICSVLSKMRHHWAVRWRRPPGTA